MDNIDPGLVALALSVGYLTNVLVDIVKQILGRSRKRRWVLPLAGLLIGICLVGLLQVYREEPWTVKTAAGTLLAGIVAFGLAALTNDQSAKAEEASGRG